MKLHLVLDVGNTLMQMGIFAEERLLDRRAFPSDAKGVRQFEAYLKERSGIEAVAIASVKTDVNPSLARVLDQQSLVHTFFKDAAFTVELDVDNPREVGMDRVANLYGARALDLLPGIVIDIGTAITFDVLFHPARFAGGMIAPGLRLGAKALADQTDALPEVHVERPDRATSRNTVGNIRSGLYFGAVGMLKEGIKRLKEENFPQEKIKVVLTGGSVRHLGPALTQDLQGYLDVVEPDLTLIGLREMLQEYLSSHKERTNAKERPNVFC